ncbi:MAG: GNAT family N-acetyltransferase [Anaerolineae bacterium]
MVALSTPSNPPFRGLRRFDITRDIGPTSYVIGEAFASELGANDRAVLRQLRMMRFLSPLLWLAARTTPDFDAILGGFVWVEDGRIVGTLTLNRTVADDYHWLISNVGVLPEYRRRGIARELVTAAVEDARARGGRVVTLQVRENNVGAYQLYSDLGFRFLEKTHSLEAERPVSPQVETAPLPVRALRMGDLEAAMTLAREVTPETYQSLVPLRRGEFIPPDSSDGWADGLYDFVRGYHLQRMVVPDGDRLAALMTVRTRLRGGVHQLDLSISPAWRGRIETPLIAQVLSMFARHAQRPVNVDVNSRETDAVAVLQSFGFRIVTTLDRLGLPLGPPTR